jgi:hypothetical protein
MAYNETPTKGTEMNIYHVLVIALSVSLVTYAMVTQSNYKKLNELHRENVEKAWNDGFKRGYESVSESPLTAKMVYDRHFKYNKM